MSRKFDHVAVLLGGWSAEREVSLVSGAECAAALRAEGYQVSEIDVDRNLAPVLSDLKPDCCFNALHGRWGEDGCVQGLLEVLDIPYSHSGVLASSLAMDKQKAKEVFVGAGLPVAEGIVLPASEAASDHPMEPPYVVKPVAEGSSVAVHIILDRANGPARELLDEVCPDRAILAERYIPGRELTVSVMDGRALAVTDIFADVGIFYNYEAKYAAGGSHHIVPANVPEGIAEACKRQAEQAHEALGCRGVSRTDFRWDEERGLDGLIVLEVNTQPGMTPTSLVPEQAAHVGWLFESLVSWMVEDASCLR